jgi:RsmE family RNA methyltransferase
LSFSTLKYNLFFVDNNKINGKTLNIILFEKEELDRKMSIHDPRIWHIRKILNKAKGEKFDIGIINGPKGKGWIKEISNNKVTLGYQLKDRIEESLSPVSLIIGHPRPQSLKKIFRETTALGVSEILIAGTEKGEKSYFQSKIWKKVKFRKYLIEGAQQAHSTLIPIVNKFNKLDQCLKNTEHYFPLIALDNINPHKKLTALKIEQGSNPILAIGSERGWSPEERKLLIHKGFKLYKLGDRVLRTETAAVAGTTILLDRMNIL